MSKPAKTAADYMVIALSPALIMALVGSLCFFLVEVFYRGQMKGAVIWVLFWFVIAIVLITRIAIESGRDRAAVFGFCLALATWFYLVRTQPAYFLGLLLLAIVWFCAHNLVWDCTLIDEEQDSSGQGLLQAVNAAPAAKAPPAKKPARKKPPPQNPGRWVLYFSVAALPLFGIGQMVLPLDETGARRSGLVFLSIYLAAALGLLLTTSFLGLRRYLRQRYLKMPPSIAAAWLKFGAAVAILVLGLAYFLPRPGAREAWVTLRYQIDYQLRRASQYAAPQNAPGKGEGRPGSESGGKEGSAHQPSRQQENKAASGQSHPSQTAPPQTAPVSAPAGPTGSIYNLLRAAFWIAVLLVVGGWVVRKRYLLLAMIRSAIEAIRQFFRKLLDLAPRKAVKKAEPELKRRRVKFETFAHCRNPFFAAKDHAWPAEQIILYSYEALQVWAREQGLSARPEETAREFCARLGGERLDLAQQLPHLARLYAYAAFGKTLPDGSDLEPIRELWRRLPTAGLAKIDQ